METKLTPRERAHSQLKALIKKYQEQKDSLQDGNEAKTRLLLIDEVLKILGWDESEFNPEAKSGTAGYIDYLLEYDGKPCLVVEAKKYGITFSSNNKKTITKHEYPVSYFKQAFNASLTDAIKQSAAYCWSTGVSFALITNGAEWMLFQLIPSMGSSIEKMQGVYFGNLFSESFYFDQLWELVSKDGVSQGQPHSYLYEINYSPSPVCKLLQSEIGPLRWSESPSPDFLNEFYSEFFGEIIHGKRQKMLEHCFVGDSKLEQYKRELKSILKDSKPNFLPPESEDFDPMAGKEEIFKEVGSGRVVIITGAVGCGKTTLVNKALYEARRYKKGTTLPLLVDLINDVHKRASNAKGIILKRAREAISEKEPELRKNAALLKAFKSEIKEIREGPYTDIYDSNEERFIEDRAAALSKFIEDDELYLKRILKSKTSENVNVVLILDNADKASEDFQEELYVTAHSLAEATGATVIITMREFTFFNNMNGFLDVRPDDKVIHLKTPDFVKLISKRLSYIEKHFDEDYRCSDWRRLYDIKTFKQASQAYSNQLRENLLKNSDGSKIIEVISCAAWHNVRSFYSYLGRIHKDLGADVSYWNISHLIASFSVVKELEKNPVIPNIFIPYGNDNYCYFLKLRILHYLNDGLEYSERNHGVNLNRLISFAQHYGYRDTWIEATVKEAVKERLIECLELPSDSEELDTFELSRGETFRISPLGVAVLGYIIKEDVYFAVSAPSIPFHEAIEYEAAKRSFNSVFSFMGEKGAAQVFIDGVDILRESTLPKQIKHYLSTRYAMEKPSNQAFYSIPDIERVESKLAAFISEVKKSSSDNTQERSKSPEQMVFSLNDELLIEDSPDGQYSRDDILTLIPEKILTLRYENSEYIPLIFCAIVIRFSQGFEHSSGIEITKTINEYIMPEGEEKESTNVSRALRSGKVERQPWLIIRSDIHIKYKNFSLADDWREHWVTVFGDEPLI